MIVIACCFRGVKYLGEHGENVPVAGAVAICSPWDLLIGDRFISRRLVQKLYDRALCIGLQGINLIIHALPIGKALERYGFLSGNELSRYHVGFQRCRCQHFKS
ncbi:hypothetical protein RHGRI_017180 [Rhododendron griersonianum]|uniref:Uncharacterized protein n=1 Tax=Rhododendron griersonianum TaxID=479676 RepID=A0AAV6JWV0_9ERIC|nr:hypothetical protein RHGRI_017180 [Rhododendron griersonianum]